jgi:hypothetical protein
VRLGRRLALALLAVAAMGLAGLPVVFTVVFRWYRTTVFSGVTGKGSGIYIILVVFYVFWLPLVLAGMLIVFDRLGYRYEPREPKRLPTRRQRKRTIAGMRFLSARPTIGQTGQGRRRKGGHDSGSSPGARGGG